MGIHTFTQQEKRERVDVKWITVNLILFVFYEFTRIYLEGIGEIEDFGVNKFSR
jgi:hypothetical protein